MIKRIGVYFFLSLVLLFSLFYIHVFVLEANELMLSYPLLKVYIFNAISSIVVYLLLEFTFKQLPNQVGFAYLTLVFVKLGLFLMIFSEFIFADKSLEKFESISLLIPVFMYLALEAGASFRLLYEE